jgi:hypothetical protein
VKHQPVCKVSGEYCTDCLDAGKMPAGCDLRRCNFPDMEPELCPLSTRCPCATWEWTVQTCGVGPFTYLRLHNARAEDAAWWWITRVLASRGRGAEDKLRRRRSNRRNTLPSVHEYGLTVVA